MQDGLHGGVLKVRRVPVLTENAFHQNPHPRPRRFPVLPIHGSVVFQIAQQLVGDDAELVVAHDLDCALVLGQSVIKGDFLLAEPFLLAASVSGTDVLGEVDQLLNNLCRRDGVRVVAGDRLLQPLGEGAGLHDVDPGP